MVSILHRASTCLWKIEILIFLCRNRYAWVLLSISIWLLDNLFASRVCEMTFGNPTAYSIDFYSEKVKKPTLFWRLIDSPISSPSFTHSRQDAVGWHIGIKFLLSFSSQHYPMIWCGSQQKREEIALRERAVVVGTLKSD